MWSDLTLGPSHKGRLFVYGRALGSAGSAFCFPYNSVTDSFQIWQV